MSETLNNSVVGDVHTVGTGPDAEPVSRRSGAADGPTSCRCTARRLLERHDVLGVLQLSDEQVQDLINTRQITAIRIAGEERFDSRDLERLIEAYKATALRRAS